MLKRAASYALNRLFILALVALALNTYARTSCRAGGSFVEPFEQALSGLREVARALQ